MFSRAGVRALDRAAAEELQIPTLLLMENAATALEECCAEVMREKSLERVAIICGPGNNGGDGLALARRLANRGLDPFVGLTAPADRFRGDAEANLSVVERMGLRVVDPILALSPQAAIEIIFRDGYYGSSDEELRRLLIVDAMIGTGLDRPLSSPAADAARWMNALRGRGATVVSADIPSGLDADSGLPIGLEAVQADVTVTFAGLKLGFLQACAWRYTGRIVVGDIGAPAELLRRFALPPIGRQRWTAPGMIDRA